MRTILKGAVLLEIQWNLERVMKKLLAFICVSMMVFVFVPFQAPAEAADTFDLNGKWKGTMEWKGDYELSEYPISFEIVQKGMEITLTTISPPSKTIGTLKGNIVYFEPRDLYVGGGWRTDPAREYKISEDGKILSSTWACTWIHDSGMRGRSTIKLILVRE